MDAGRVMPAHSWVSRLAPAANRSHAHNQRSLATAHIGGPAAQDVSLYPAHHSLGIFLVFPSEVPPMYAVCDGGTHLCMLVHVQAEKGWHGAPTRARTINN